MSCMVTMALPSRKITVLVVDINRLAHPAPVAPSGPTLYPCTTE